MFSFLKKLFKKEQPKPIITRQQIQQEYQKHPKLCKQCKQPIPYRKRINFFCSKSCAVSFNNRLRKTQPKSSQRWKKRFALIEAAGQFPCNPRTSQTNNKVAKKYLLQKYGAKCSICGIKKWFGKPILLIVDHIDGNATNNKLQNFRLVCPNCDSQLPTFAGRNRGKGRQSRRYNYWSSK